jgi:nicotinamide-nucleotide amidase
VTGFAGAGAQDCAGSNPVGTIFIALHAPHGVWSKKVSWPGPRQTVKVRAVNAALDWLRRELVRAQKGAAMPERRTGVMQ